MESLWLKAFLINFVLISVGQNFPLLTKKGWFHAAILGTILWGCLGWRGWLSVCLYLILGSIVTKVGYKEKKLKGIAEAREGKRGPENVWGSAATGCFLALMSNFLPNYSNLFIIGFCASFAAKLADTFGSELGKMYGKNTFLITTFERVKAGTEGAISIEGTLASLFGSLLMTLGMVALSLISGKSIIIIVFLSGFVATIVESYIGAILQRRLKYFTNEFVNSIQTSLAALISIGITYMLNLTESI